MSETSLWICLQIMAPMRRFLLVPTLPLPLPRPASNTHNCLWALWSDGEYLGLGVLASGLVSGNTASSLPLRRPCLGHQESHAQPHYGLPSSSPSQICLPLCQVCCSPHLHPYPPEARLSLSLNALWQSFTGNVTRTHTCRHVVCAHTFHFQKHLVMVALLLGPRRQAKPHSTIKNPSLTVTEGTLSIQSPCFRGL